MKSFVNTVVGGMIGLAALYVVGRIAYQAGHDVAEAECHYNEIRKKTKAIASPKEQNPEQTEETIEEEPVVETLPVKRQSKLGLMMGLKRLAGKKDSVIGHLIHNPEAHRIEAFVDGDELKVSVKPRTA